MMKLILLILPFILFSSETDAKIHLSLDVNKDGSCDQAIDYSLPRKILEDNR